MSGNSKIKLKYKPGLFLIAKHGNRSTLYKTAGLDDKTMIGTTVRESMRKSNITIWVIGTAGEGMYSDRAAWLSSEEVIAVGSNLKTLKVLYGINIE